MKWKKSEKGKDLILVQLQNPNVILFMTYHELTAIFWSYSTCISQIDFSNRVVLL